MLKDKGEVGEGDGVVSVVVALGRLALWPLVFLAPGLALFHSPLYLLYISVPAFPCLSFHIFNFMTCTFLGNRLGPFGTLWNFTGFQRE